MAKTSRRTPSEVLCGTAAAPGIAVGPVLRIEDPAIRVEEWEVPEHVREEWLELDLSLRKFVVSMGATRRDALTGRRDE